jgi:hypothetical protein
MNQLVIKNTSLVALVDDSDFARCSIHTWTINDMGYCLSSCAILRQDTRHVYERIYLSRYVLGITDPSVVVDHINRDPLDNRKSNLRICSRAENSLNQKKREGTSSKYKGVTFDKKSSKWRARVVYEKVEYHLGFFEEEKEAAIAVNNFYAKHKPEFRIFNIIES